MPNLIAPKGFVPSRHINGSPYNGNVNVYILPQADSTAVYPGDLVKSVANGDANGIPAVTKCASNDTLIRGVVVGVFVANPFGQSLSGNVLDLTSISAPATKTRDYYLMVMDDPMIMCEIQDDGLNALTATSCNKNATYTVAAPTAPQQMSATVLTTGTVAVTATLPLKIMGLVQRPDNAFGVNAKWLVKFNTHELGYGTLGV